MRKLIVLVLVLVCFIFNKVKADSPLESLGEAAVGSLSSTSFVYILTNGPLGSAKCQITNLLEVFKGLDNYVKYNGNQFGSNASGFIISLKPGAKQTNGNFFGFSTNHSFLFVEDRLTTDDIFPDLPDVRIIGTEALPYNGAVFGSSGITIFESGGTLTDFVTLFGGFDITASYSLFLPESQGGNRTVMTNDGSGNLGWYNPDLLLVTVTNFINTFQGGRAVLTNLIGTVARNVTNVISLSTSNTTSKPLTNSYTLGTLTLFGLEAGANVTLTMNDSNIVIASTGGLTTNANQFLGVPLAIIDGASVSNLNVTGILSITNKPGLDRAIRLWNTNLNGYIEISAPTNSWLPTNKLVISITNPAAGQFLRIQNVTFNNGVALITITNIPAEATAQEIMSNNVATAGGIRVGLATNVVYKFPLGSMFLTNNTDSNNVEITLQPYRPFAIFDKTNIFYEDGNWVKLFDEEFMGDSSDNNSTAQKGTYSWVGGGSGTTPNPAAVPFEKGLKGAISLMATQANSGKQLQISSSGAFTMGTTNLEIIALFRFKLLRTNTANDKATFRMGITSGASVGEPSNGIYLRTSTNENNGIDLVTLLAGTIKTNWFPNAGLQENAWTNAGFWLDGTGTNVVMVIGSSPTNLVSIATNSASIPNANLISPWFNTYKLQASAGNVGNTNLMDYIRIWVR